MSYSLCLAVLLSAAAAEDDAPRVVGTMAVNVPVPVEELDPDARGALQVTGEPGPGQESRFRYARCKGDSSGGILAQSCGGWEEAALNEPVLARAGVYVLDYSNSSYPKPVRVRKGVLSEVKLVKIKVPHVDSTYRFSVFNDLTKREMQDRYLSVMSATAEFPLLGMCRANPNSRDAVFLAACRALQSGDPLALRDTLFRFDAEGAVSVLEVSCYDGTHRKAGPSRYGRPRRSWVTDPKDGESVSVFPGTYGVEFQNRNGESTVRYGIRAR
ncbi:MAG: hypothetical protein WC728_01015 [Elusimicrobiota bacterium]